MHSLCSYEKLYKISHSYYIYIFRTILCILPVITSTYVLYILPTSVSSLILFTTDTLACAHNLPLPSWCLACHFGLLLAVCSGSCGLQCSFSDLVSRALRMLYITIPQSCAGRGVITMISCDRWHRRCSGPSQRLAEGWSKKKISWLHHDPPSLTPGLESPARHPLGRKSTLEFKLHMPSWNVLESVAYKTL
jgi:hypothetical protein